MALTRQYRTWIDVNGDTALTYITANATPGPLITQMMAVSNADFLNLVEATFVVNTTPTPNTAVFRSVLDQAVLVYKCADFTDARLTIPAPQAAIFLGDDETVNPAAVSLVTTAAAGLLVSASGSPAVALVSGTRVRKSQSLLK